MPFYFVMNIKIIIIFIFLLSAQTNTADNNFLLVSPNHITTLYYDKNDYDGVIRAVGDLKNDIFMVTNQYPKVSHSIISAELPVIIGTIGKNSTIDDMLKRHVINSNDLFGKWESYVITTVEKPCPGIKRALVIAGSDKRGTIYGIYDISRRIGVSPWYWWADVPIMHKDTLHISEKYFASGEPKVRYRGIFINDEYPSMTSWARKKFGGMNSKMYAHVYELLLRLKGNCLWPAMWGSFKEYNPLVPILKDSDGRYEGNDFNEDDLLNPKTANDYGIIIGTSHHEPMQRSQQEWIRHHNNYGNGEWNYLTNSNAIRRFFNDGIEHCKNYENIITIGMRGDEDRPMVDAGSAKKNFNILERIMTDQRKIISNVYKKPASTIPQVWPLYSEVLEYYTMGMKVPDDVIIMLCDNNWGNVRKLPDLTKPLHKGGYGMYYHVSYYGAPRAYKWLNVTPLQLIWEQTEATYDYGVDKMWMLNVGDIKPEELPISFFLDMAWNPHKYKVNDIISYTKDWCKEQLGTEQANEASYILNMYGKYSGRITPEMMSDSTYDLQSGEFKSVRDEFMALETRALRQYMTLKDEYRDAYKELILFPVQAMANIYDMYYSLAMNKKLASIKDIKANEWADRVEYCFYRDSLLCYDYNHHVAGGKWNHMMDQIHIGYNSWHAPQFNKKPEVKRISENEEKNGEYMFYGKYDVVVMEAEHYNKTNANKDTQWQIIPDFGRTLSGISLWPYTKSTDHCYLQYAFTYDCKKDSVKIHIIMESTMPFVNGGHKLIICLDNDSTEININSDLTWINNYSKMYPAGAERIIEKVIMLSYKNNINKHKLTIHPLTPGIMFEKIIIDYGGYKNCWLKMNESDYSNFHQSKLNNFAP
jgi:hypothetical protein